MQSSNSGLISASGGAGAILLKSLRHAACAFITDQIKTAALRSNTRGPPARSTERRGRWCVIDLIMADKNHFERCTLELFADLGLTGASYRNPSKRKQNLERALQELQGILLTTGVLKSAIIERTKNGKDFKVVFHKVARRDFELGEPATTFVTTEPVVINDYSKTKDPIVEQAEALVGSFYKLFSRS